MFLHPNAALASCFTQTGVDAREDLGNAKVGDLELAVLSEEQVFEFDVAVGDSIAVEVGPTPLDELLYETGSVAGAFLLLEIFHLAEAE